MEAEALWGGSSLNGLQGWRRGWAQEILWWQSARPLLFTGLGNEEQIRVESQQIRGMGWGGMLDSILAY